MLYKHIPQQQKIPQLSQHTTRHLFCSERHVHGVITGDLVMRREFSRSLTLLHAQIYIPYSPHLLACQEAALCKNYIQCVFLQRYFKTEAFIVNKQQRFFFTVNFVARIKCNSSHTASYRMTANLDLYVSIQTKKKRLIHASPVFLC